jgi:hypothetical protein
MAESQKAEKLPKRGGRPSLAGARFCPLAHFGHFLFTESQMVEEIWAEFHRTIVGLRRDYSGKINRFQEKSQVLLVFFNEPFGFLIFSQTSRTPNIVQSAHLFRSLKPKFQLCHSITFVLHDIFSSKFHWWVKEIIVNYKLLAED